MKHFNYTLLPMPEKVVLPNSLNLVTLGIILKLRKPPGVTNEHINTLLNAYKN